MATNQACRKHQRVKLTEQQLNDRKAPCPNCGQVIGIVPNQAKKEATLSPHGPIW
jgi:predicted RNA-binding Zn-ribbon protein involved in translation (DUF1610 family)